MRRRHQKPPPNQVLGGDSFFKPKVQKKLAMGTPGDKYEVEADHMADQVVNKTGSGDAIQKMEGEEEVQQKPLAASVTPLIQKMETSEEEPVQKMEEEEPVQAMEEEEAVQAMEEEEPVQAMEEEEPVQAMEEEESVQKMEEEEPVQAKKRNPTSTNPNIEGKLRHGSGGSKMDPQTQSEMESGFGADFSAINIHNDSEAAQMSKDIGAQAFTHGNDVYFNDGKYNPDSKEGKHLLAHELTHTIQQKGGVSKKIQRHMQSSYPWDGIITTRWSAGLRPNPNKTGFIANIPNGTRLTVLGNSNNWLLVRVLVNGKQRTGYISQELVGLSTTDNVTDEMNSLVGESAAWFPSGPAAAVGDTSGNDFADWASATSEASAPNVNGSTTINCWEMILLSGYRTGAVTWKWIHELYINQPLSNWVNYISPSRSVYTPGDPIPRGKVVFFNGVNHVALATGNHDDVLTFWPPPDFTSYTRGTVDEVKVRTAASLISAMGGSGSVVVEIGDPVW